MTAMTVGALKALIKSLELKDEDHIQFNISNETKDVNFMNDLYIADISFVSHDVWRIAKFSILSMWFDLNLTRDCECDD